MMLGRCRRSSLFKMLPATVLLCLACSSRVAGEEAASSQPGIDQDGTIHIPAMAVPFSALASEEAKRRFIEQSVEAAKSRATAQVPEEVSTEEDLTRLILKRREAADGVRKKIAHEMTKIFPVTIVAKTIGGVQTDVVTPRDGVSPRNKDRVLINLHGGGMIFGARYEGQIMSIPIASLGKIKVVTVDYRMAPEHRFPAASEDVANVYAELLKEYRPENVGIYGCSAGGWLTAQSVAWFQKHDLPRPGAIGILGVGSTLDGDSYYVSFAMSGSPAPTEPFALSKAPFARALALYGSNADARDPLYKPIDAPAVLAKFPPALFINSTRDFTMSGAVHDHLQFTKAGVPAELYIWDGLEHCFMYESRLPESRDSYDILVKFFERRLGKS